MITTGNLQITKVLATAAANFWAIVAWKFAEAKKLKRYASNASDVRGLVKQLLNISDKIYISSHFAAP